MKKNSEKTKGTILMVFSVMIAFTLINIINGYNIKEWYMYLLSVIIFPFITWGMCEITYYFMKKDYNNLKK